MTDKPEIIVLSTPTGRFGSEPEMQGFYRVSRAELFLATDLAAIEERVLAAWPESFEIDLSFKPDALDEIRALQELAITPEIKAPAKPRYDYQQHNRRRYRK